VAAVKGVPSGITRIVVMWTTVSAALPSTTSPASHRLTGGPRKTRAVTGERVSFRVGRARLGG